jgi:CheY-like chemotaxis protein
MTLQSAISSFLPLTNAGYRTVEAADGEEALRVAAGLGGEELKLLLKDVVMPRMGGTRLSQ